MNPSANTDRNQLVKIAPAEAMQHVDGQAQPDPFTIKSVESSRWEFSYEDAAGFANGVLALW